MIASQIGDSSNPGSYKRYEAFWQDKHRAENHVNIYFKEHSQL